MSSKGLYIVALVLLAISLMLPAVSPGGGKMPGYECFAIAAVLALDNPPKNPERGYQQICACRVSVVANSCAVLLLFLGRSRWARHRIGYAGLFVFGALLIFSLISLIGFASSGVLGNVYIGFCLWWAGLMFCLLAGGRSILIERKV